MTMYNEAGALGGSIPGLVRTLDLHSLQIRAFEGESVSVTDLLALLALTGSASLDGLSSRRAWRAALTATGAVSRATLTSTGAMLGSSLSSTGAASVGLLGSATGITGSTPTINNTANAENFTIRTSRFACNSRCVIERTCIMMA